MHRAFLIGTKEKHRVDFRVHWWGGFMSVTCDGKPLLRRPFFFKVDRSFEIGKDEKHMVRIIFNFFDYFRDVFKMTVDGLLAPPSMEIRHKKAGYDFTLPDTAVDDAAAAFLFTAVINLIFAVIGTLFVPDLDALSSRLVLFLAAMVYFLFSVMTVRREASALIVGTVLFVLDSVYSLKFAFSVGGLVVRMCLFYYLVAGLLEFRREELRKA